MAHTLDQRAMDEILVLEHEIKILTQKHKIVMENMADLEKTCAVFRHVCEELSLGLSPDQVIPVFDEDYGTVQAIEEKLARKSVQMNDFITRYELDIPLTEVYVPKVKNVLEQMEKKDAARLRAQIELDDANAINNLCQDDFEFEIDYSVLDIQYDFETHDVEEEDSQTTNAKTEKTQDNDDEANGGEIKE